MIRGSSATSPKVSIGLPVYNGERYLGDALEALLGQTFKDFELIISDNASTDRTQQICQEYASKDCRIQYYRQPVNSSMIENFNWVFRKASGDYFMWAAYDDLWSPAFISTCVAGLETHQDAVLCMTDVQMMDDDGVICSTLVKGYETLGLSLRNRIRLLLRHNGPCLAVYGLIRRRALVRTGLFRIVWPPDLCLLFELSIFGSFVRMPTGLFYYRKFRKNRNQEVLSTVHTVCDPKVKAPVYPFTAIYLLTQAWINWYKMVVGMRQKRGVKFLLFVAITQFYPRVFRLEIYRWHRLKLYSFHVEHHRLGVITAYMSCLFFSPSCLLNYDFFSLFLEAVLGNRFFILLRKTKRVVAGDVSR